MMAALHTHKKTQGFGTFDAACEAPLNPVMTAVFDRLPKEQNGFFRSLSFTSPIPEDIKKELTAEFEPYRAVEDSFVVDTRTEHAAVYADGILGLEYGLYALVQMAEESADGKTVERGLYWDQPRCPFRGLKVYMPAPDDLDSFYRTVDLLVSLRYNTIIMEVGGAMEYKRHPEINSAWIEFCKEMGKYPERADEVQNHTYPWAKNSIHFENGGGLWLKQETVRTLVDYARARGLEVIPECPTLSHADYLLMPHMELAERDNDDFPDVYCPSNPDTYKLVFDVLEEVISVFQPKIMHIGHDEYYSIGICPRCKGKAAEDIYADDILKIYSFLKERGIRTMLWAEKLLDAIGLTGQHFGGSEQRVRHPDGTVEIVRPATWRCIDKLPRDLICHHWYWGIAEYFDDEFNKRGMPLWYGNFEPVGFLDWNRRLAQGAQGGSPSHWSSLEDATLQRNGVYMSLFYGVRLFWDRDYDDSRFDEYLPRTLEEMFRTANRKTLAGPHFRIVHYTTIQRKYQYLSSVPMQLQRDQIGRYELTYSDGTVITVPVIYGLNITNCSRIWERKHRGRTVDSYGVSEADTYAFDPLLREVSYTTLPQKQEGKTVFEIVVPDPHPEKNLSGVRIVKTCEDEGEIVLCSIQTE